MAGMSGRGDPAGGHVGRVAGGVAPGGRRRAAPHRGGAGARRARRRARCTSLQEGAADTAGMEAVALGRRVRRGDPAEVFVFFFAVAVI